jgi:predicted transcriptional regulator
VGREAAVHCATRIGLRGAEIARALGITQQAVSRMRDRGIRDEIISLSTRVLRRIGLEAVNA